MNNELIGLIAFISFIAWMIYDIRQKQKHHVKMQNKIYEIKKNEKIRLATLASNESYSAEKSSPPVKNHLKIVK